MAQRYELRVRRKPAKHLPASYPFEPPAGIVLAECLHNTHLPRTAVLRERTLVCLRDLPIDGERDLHLAPTIGGKHESHSFPEHVVTSHDTLQREHSPSEVVIVLAPDHAGHIGNLQLRYPGGISRIRPYLDSACGLDL